MSESKKYWVQCIWCGNKKLVFQTEHIYYGSMCEECGNEMYTMKGQ